MKDLRESEVPVQHDMRKDYTKDVKKMEVNDKLDYKPALGIQRERLSQHH